MFFKKFYIIYISLLLILIKWFFSFYFFQEEIDVRVLFESVADGKYYFPLIKFLSDLNFNLSFDPSIENLKIVPIPISTLFFYSILKPNFLILNINNNFYDITKLKLIDYCIEFQGNNYILFKQKNKYKCKKEVSHLK